MGSSSCSGFHTCSGVWICSGCKFVRVFSVRFLQRVRTASAALRYLTNIKMCHNISSVSCAVRVFSVENLWRSLRESLLKNGGKVSTNWQNNEFCTRNSELVGVFHDLVEKFSSMVSTWFNWGKWIVLHSFHRLYYNYYYYIRWFWNGTAKICGRIKKVNI